MNMNNNGNKKDELSDESQRHFIMITLVDSNVTLRKLVPAVFLKANEETAAIN